MIRRPPTQIVLSARDVDDMRTARAHARARAEAEAEADAQAAAAASNAAAAAAGAGAVSSSQQAAGFTEAGSSQQVSVVGETQHAFSSQFQSQSQQTQDWGGPLGSQQQQQQPAESRREAMERERRAMPAHQRIMGGS
ncbi:hypothetical protein OC835_001607 [Tilletia horrida]|nr:hypothetical protein OC835_001607 [Tilletia horrida]